MMVSYEIKFNATAFSSEDGKTFTVSMDGADVTLQMSKDIAWDLFQALSAEFHSLSPEQEVTEALR